MKSFSITESPPPEKFPPADNLPVKIRPARTAGGRGGFLPVNCRPGGNFSDGRRSYNGTPADLDAGRSTARRQACFRSGFEADFSCRSRKKVDEIDVVIVENYRSLSKTL